MRAIAVEFVNSQDSTRLEELVDHFQIINKQMEEQFHKEKIQKKKESQKKTHET